MQVLIYQLGDCPRELLAAAIKRNPTKTYLLLPASMDWLMKAMAG